MYDHHRRGAIVPPIPADAAVNDENVELIQNLDDVEEMFGDPIFIRYATDEYLLRLYLSEKREKKLIHKK